MHAQVYIRQSTKLVEISTDLSSLLMMFTVTVTLLPYLILSVLGLVSGDTGSGSGLGQFSKLYPEQVTATIEPDCSNNSGINGHNKAVITITWELPSGLHGVMYYNWLKNTIYLLNFRFCSSAIIGVFWRAQISFD